jgi:hypothetical protein
MIPTQAINYISWASQNKESSWPYSMTNGTCTSTIYGATSGQAVKLSSGATRVSPTSDETALKTVGNVILQFSICMQWTQGENLLWHNSSVVGDPDPEDFNPPLSRAGRDCLPHRLLLYG